MAEPTGDLIVDALRAQAEIGRMVGRVTKNTASALTTVGQVLDTEIHHRQVLQQTASVLMQRAGLQNIGPAEIEASGQIAAIDPQAQATINAATGEIDV